MISATAAILAGGLGTRLRLVLADRPKVLAEFHGRPFLAYLFDHLLAAGVRSTVLCTGYRGEEVRAILGSSYAGLQLMYSQEASPLGTGGALRLALPLFKSDPVLILNGDSFCDADLNAALTWHCAHGANATLVLARMLETARYGRVRVADDGAILSFEEKTGGGGPGWINAGIYLLTRSLLLTIPSNRIVSLEEELFPSWIGRGLYGYQSRANFLDIGTPEAYAAAGRFLASRTGKWQREGLE